MHCSSLTSVEIPNSVTHIGNGAFSSCVALKSVTIPNSVLSIVPYAFQRCSALTSVYYGAEYPIEGDYYIFDESTYENATLYMSEKGIAKGRTIDPWKNFDNIEEYFEYTYEGQTLKYTVLDKASKTCEVAKNYVSGNVAIPAIAKDGEAEYTVTSIGNMAFDECRGLTSVEIPATVESIHFGAFYNCSSLVTVEIPNSVTSIDESAFSHCIALRSVTIPSSVTSIEDYAFYCCNDLTSIEVASENTSYASLDGVLFNKDLSTLIQFPCARTGDYEVPSSVTSIGFASFAYCAGLSSVNIPASVTYIGEEAFEGCTGLPSVTIPASITSIGIGAFNNCDALTSVYYGADEPIEDELRIFDYLTYDRATLYMSEKGIEKGRTINPWKNFVNIEVYDFDGIEAVDADVDTDKPCEVYNISGAKVGNATENLAPGIYIVRQGNAVKKIAVQ